MSSQIVLKALQAPEAIAGVAAVIALFVIRVWFITREKKIEDSPVLGNPGEPAFGDALEAGYQKVSHHVPIMLV